ncbi:RidA family protein [Geomonas sp. Red69]|uniref:RidA family protein n=1 Tax=Geomonas diazotrophica TaxID=2843197 RepID=A0ABX8JM54_9BACT|nr:MULTISPECIES: RidA family protein [Geomonas]MBU5636753.1 RidA family protein [Geomonas diazotrophica]QWV98437.1 RidA family protein [Geomonas nitrogeniifigens]QXE87619.1 RidA family protein [Geomonas nitrogeniifigens]
MKEIISTENAPKAIGPYSQGVKAGGFLFLSGAIALDPATGEVVQGGVVAETEQVMKNIGALLAAAGLGFQDVVKTTIYLANMGDFATVNGIYGAHFQENPPARSTVEVKGLPRGVLVEIEVTALCR